MSLRLIVAATEGELSGLRPRLESEEPLSLRYGLGVRGSVAGVPLALLTLGVGKVNTAAGLALAIEMLEPTAVVQIGIGGAFPGSRLGIGEAAVASEEVHLDCGVQTGGGFEEMEELGFPLLSRTPAVYNRIPVDERLSNALAGEVCPQLPFGTAETVTGQQEAAAQLARRFGVALESMEGAAAAQVCLALGVPFAEVRGVSNLVADRDKTRWRIDLALAAAHETVAGWLRRGGPGTEQ